MFTISPLLAIGQSEIIIIAVVAVLLFGGAKLPELAKGLGESIREFKGAMDNDTPTTPPTPPVEPVAETPATTTPPTHTV